jgi:hypothetical protein
MFPTNISIGYTTNFSSSATGINNFAAGTSALSKNTTGCNNTAIGRQALLVIQQEPATQQLDVMLYAINTTGGTTQQ